MKKLLKASWLILFISFVLPVGAEAADVVGGKGSLTIDSVKKGEDIFDPEYPQNPVDPGESEKVGDNLRIDFVPELRFGSHKVSESETVYHAFAQNFISDTPARANYLQISDFRPEEQGWTLTLHQEKQFHSINDENVELRGSTLFFDNSWASSTSTSKAPKIQTEIITVDPGSSYIVATAEKGTGAGTWLISFGGSRQELPNIGNTLTETDILDDRFANKPVLLNRSVGLRVPVLAKPQSVEYTTMLTWTLSELP